MTAIYEPVTDLATAPQPALAPIEQHDALAARHEALTALDSFVRPLLAQVLRLPFTFAAPVIELSVYDEVYRRSKAGGHWTVVSRWTGLLTHAVAAYTIALHFDAEDRADHFVIAGARTVVTPDATPEALARGLEAVAAGGPLITWAPNFPPGVSL